MILILMIAAMFGLYLGFRLYSRRILFFHIPPNPKHTAPARRYQDGFEFMPTPSGSLLGYQFKSISLDPILGPIIAIQFGWLPALLWLVFGLVFAGWIQDYALTMISIRSAGASFGTLAGDLLSPSARTMLLILIYLFLLLTMAAFSVIIAPILARESVPLGIFCLILTSLLAGQMVYRWRLPFLAVALISLPLAVASIYVGSLPAAQSIIRSINQLVGGSLDQLVGTGEVSGETFLWGFALLGVAYLGAVLPVWRFTQPVNSTASLVTLLAMSAAGLGLLVAVFTGEANTGIEIPALVAGFQPHLGPLWPVLFVTISSGAVSGFHALVSTYSTSRLVDKEVDTLPVTAGAAFLETCLALLAIVFAVTLGVSAGRYAPDQNFMLVAGPASVFVTGLQTFLGMLGLPPEAGALLGIIVLALIALAVLQLLLRINRMVAQELAGPKIPLFRNPAFAAMVGFLVTCSLILSGFWQNLWVLFGGSNQVLAGIALLLISTWLERAGKPYYWTFIPGAFLLLTGLAALFYVSLYSLLYQGVYLSYRAGSGVQFGNALAALLGICIAFISVGLFTQSLVALKTAKTRIR
jgi:carbon starvation protein